MRGKLLRFSRTAETLRITPADAGKTAAGLSDCRAGWDHPRRCGENLPHSGHCSATSGSPPQMRGKHARVLRLSDRRGITPADAGKTATDIGVNMTAQDHPRRCGENHSGVVELGKERGSPPQVRGKLKQTNGRLSMTRITPAGAGKTSLSA